MASPRAVSTLELAIDTVGGDDIRPFGATVLALEPDDEGDLAFDEIWTNPPIRIGKNLPPTHFRPGSSHRAGRPSARSVLGVSGF